MDSSPQLRQALTGAEASSVDLLVVDMAGVRKLDSSGIATLVDAASRTRLRGGRFALSGIQQDVVENLDLAGLRDFFEMHARPEDLLGRDEEA